MPARRTERPSDRPGPYNFRKSTMTAVMSPMPQWPGMNPHASVNTWQPPYMQTYQPSAPVADHTQPLSITRAPSVPAQQSQSSRDRRPSKSHSISQGADGPWTAEMDSALIDAHARGLRWEQISQLYFPNKSANACRKRFGRAKEERRATDWDEHRIQRVINAYNKDGFREQMWGMLSRETGEKWQDIEKLCFSQGMSRMVQGRTGHSRNRSRVSASNTMDDSRYHSSNDEYDPRDDSGIGLGLMTGSDHHSAHVGQSTVTTGAPLEQLLVHSGHTHYAYHQ